MANGPRTIYSRRQRLAPGQYDTPFADFLDNLPGYVSQFQQNQLALGRQQLEEKRYEDDKTYRDNRAEVADKRHEDAQRIARKNKEEEQRRYRRQVKRKEENDNRREYEHVLDGISKYDYGAKEKTARAFGYDTEAQNYDSLADSQFDNLVSSREKIDKIKSLSSTGTYYDANPIMKDFSPNEINELKERDPLYYADFIKARNLFSEQEKTGMRAMPKDVSSRLSQVNSVILNTETKLIDAYRDMGYDVRAMQEAMAKGEDYQLPEVVKETMKLTGGDLSKVTSLNRDLENYRTVRNNIQSQYKIVPPKPKEGEDAKMIKMPDGTMVPAMWAETAGDEVPFGIARPDYDPAEVVKVPETVSEAIDEEDRINAMYILASAPEDSSEYKTAEQKIEAFNRFKEKESFAHEKALEPTLRERMSLVGKEKAEEKARGETSPVKFGIGPEAKIFKLPTKERSPEYYDKVLPNLTKRTASLSRQHTLNPTEANKVLEKEDEVVTNLQLAIDSMPNTKKYGKIKQKYKDTLKKYLRSWEYQGAFKGKRVVGTRYDPRTGMSFIPKEGELEKIYAELSGGKSSTPIQNILNIGGAMASPTGEIGIAPQPIQLFE